MDELKIKSDFMKLILWKIVNKTIKKKFPRLTSDSHLLINNVEVSGDDEDDYYNINLSVSVSKGLITELVSEFFKS